MVLPVSRRSLIAGSVAATAGALAPVSAARAAVPPAGRQMPGAYRYRVGDFEVTAITDGISRRPLAGDFVRNAPLEEVQAALSMAFLPTNTLSLPVTPLVVNTGRRLFLLDTGNGDLGAATTGQLLENLEAAGIDPNAIDAVVISHFHGDHINGLRSKAGEVAFPNAEIMVPAAEWAFWMDDGAMARAPEAMRGAFQNVRRVFGPMAKEVMRFEADTEIAPGLEALPAYGHTPGHTIFRIRSGSAGMLFLADTTNLPALFVRNPTWHVMFDMDGPAAAETRRRVLGMAADEGLLVHGYHYPFPAAGRIGRHGDRFRYVPVDWNPVL
jgi:glyoxylase-like metal-dependent hydrolase (beta-lactamase superfamily II)